MRKWLLIVLFMMLLSVQITLGEMCDDTPNPNDLCNLTTPIIVCDVYNYTVHTTGNVLVDSGNLTFLREGVYVANFSQSTGGYLVELCDGTTRELYVGRRFNMTWAAIALLLVFMTGFLGYASSMIEDPRLKPTKMVLFVMFIVNTFMLGIVAYVSSVNSFDSTKFSNIGLGYASINLLMILGFMWNYLFAMLGGLYKRTVDRFGSARFKK